MFTMWEIDPRHTPPHFGCSGKPTDAYAEKSTKSCVGIAAGPVHNVPMRRGPMPVHDARGRVERPAYRWVTRSVGLLMRSRAQSVRSEGRCSAHSPRCKASRRKSALWVTSDGLGGTACMMVGG